MTPIQFSSDTMPTATRIGKLSKPARKAIRKAQRKLHKALRAKDLTTFSIAVGMAQTAIGKARFQTQVR